MKKFLYLSCILYCFGVSAQIDLQCDARDLHSLYILSINEIYRIDSVNTSPTDPILVGLPAINDIGGISINANLNAVGEPETMYFVSNFSQNYYYWSQWGWINTNHLSGNASAINPGGTADYIFNLDTLDGNVYRYNGTGNGTLLLSGVDMTLGFYDVATDNEPYDYSV